MRVILRAASAAFLLVILSAGAASGQSGQKFALAHGQPLERIGVEGCNIDVGERDPAARHGGDRLDKNRRLLSLRRITPGAAFDCGTADHPRPDL